MPTQPQRLVVDYITALSKRLNLGRRSHINGHATFREDTTSELRMEHCMGVWRRVATHKLKDAPKSCDNTTETAKINAGETGVS
jgi:hypothetical protein